VNALVEICKVACKRGEGITLNSGMVIAVMTSSGKYGLFFVKGLASTSILIDACHILL
jgi:hypothetical protein